MDYLKTNYKDDKFTGMRKYEKTDNPDGTISLKDVTDYTDIGDIYSAADINTTNQAVNSLSTETTNNFTAVNQTITQNMAKVTTVRSVTFPIAGWSSSAPYTQTVAVSGITSSDIPSIGIVYPTSLTESAKANIDKSTNMITVVESLTNAIKITCQFKKPVVDMTISLKGV